LSAVPTDDDDAGDDLDVRLRWPDGITPAPVEPPPDALTKAELATASDLDEGGGTTRHGAAHSPLLPKLAGDVDGVRASVATLIAQLEGLTVATQRVPSVVSDRLAQYTETITQSARAQTAKVDDYREQSDRSARDVRSALAETDELVRTLVERLEDLFALSEAAASRVEQVGTALERALASGAGLDQDALQLIEGLHAEIRVLREHVAEVAQRAEQPPRPADDRALTRELESIREELTTLKRRVGVRAKAPRLDEDQITELVDRIGAHSQSGLGDDDMVRIAATVAKLVTDAFEIVAEEPVAPAQPAAPSKPRAVSERTRTQEGRQRKR
jgi:chromosome segregation ATPase